MVVTKKSGKPRRTVDLSPLNKHCLRETHTTEAPFFQVSRVKKNTYKIMVDAWNGYHAIDLNEESRNLTAFITPYGRYRYYRAPQGHVCSGDTYTCRANDIIKDMEKQCKVVDNTLLYDNNITGNFFHTFNYLKLCGDTGSPSMKPSNDILKVILNFSMPLMAFRSFRVALDTVLDIPNAVKAKSGCMFSDNYSNFPTYFL